MKVEVKTITPKQAEVFLASNDGNRNVRPAHVSNLARDIAAGNWQVNGDAIRFNCDGTLIDGQHRLQACVKAGKPIETLVISGLDTEVKKTIDAGAKRNAGDFFQFNGVKMANSTAAACRYALMLQGAPIVNRSYTNSETWGFYESNTGITDSVRSAAQLKAGLASVVAATHYVSTQVCPHVSDDFLETWLHGGQHGHPCATFREKVITAALVGKPFATIGKIRMCAWSLVKLMRNETTTTARLPKEFGVPGWAK